MTAPSYPDEIAHIRRLLAGDPYADSDAELSELRTAVEFLTDLVERLVVDRPAVEAPAYPTEWWRTPVPWWLNQPTCETEGI